MGTIGQYTPGNSLVHRIDPRVKLLSNILLIISVFLSKSITIQLAFLSMVVIIHLISGMGFKSLFTNLRRVIYIASFIFIINLAILKYETGDPWNYSWWIFTLTLKTTMLTILVALRIYIMIIGTGMLITTTSPMDLTRSIEDLLWPLKWLKIPINVIAMIMSIALRFIPTLMVEAKRIMKAQSSRGVDFVSGSIKQRSKAVVTLIVPLFASAFEKADDLANAMETRGYDPYEKRTRYSQYKIKFLDVLISLLMISVIVIASLFAANVFEIPWWGNLG